MAELTDSQTVFADWTVNWLGDTTWMAAQGIAQVLYGDQDKINVVPLVCVEPSDKIRQFNGAPRRTQVDFEVYVYIYYGGLQDTQISSKKANEIAEAVEARLHTNHNCDGLVISSLVSAVTSGAVNKGGALIRATRITWTARSQMMLPYVGV